MADRSDDYLQSSDNENKKTLDVLVNHVLNHQNRIGTDTGLQNSVANILAGALRAAEVENHKDLSAALTPLVISGIRQEVRNSKGELMEAMYPHMGRLMASYVSSNLRRFIQETNRQLEKNLSPKHIKLRLKSLFTGVPYKQLLLREYSYVQIEELLLLNKEDGRLVDHWQSYEEGSAEPKNDPVMVSSMLTAINQFAGEAFAGGRNELRALDFGKSCIYLRATPMHLMAIRCSGRANQRLEHGFDMELFRLMEENEDILTGNSDVHQQISIRAILPRFADQLNQLLITEIERFEQRWLSRKPVYAIVFFIAMMTFTIGWATTEVVQARARSHAQDQIENVISRNPAFRGYPVKVELDPDGQTAHLTGLSPSLNATKELLQELRGLVGDLKIVPTLVEILPVDRVKEVVGDVTDLTRRTVGGVTGSLEQKLSKLGAEISSLERGLAKGGVLKSRQKLEQIKARLQSLQSRLSNVPDSGDVVSEPAVTLGNSNLRGLNLSTEIIPDFNDPEVRKKLEAAGKQPIPKHLRRNTVQQILTGQQNQNGAGGAGGNALGGDTQSATGAVQGVTGSVQGVTQGATGAVSNTVQGVTGGVKSTTGRILNRK